MATVLGCELCKLVNAVLGVTDGRIFLVSHCFYLIGTVAYEANKLRARHAAADCLAPCGLKKDGASKM